MNNPAFEPEDFAEALERNSLSQTAQFLRTAAELI